MRRRSATVWSLPVWCSVDTEVSFLVQLEDVSALPAWDDSWRNRLRDTFRERIRGMVPSRYDDPEIRLFKIMIYAIIGVVLIMVVAGLTTFFFSLRGSEETMVPSLVNEELPDALIMLQERGLDVEVEFRVTADPALVGRVIDQTPPPGTLVRAGKTLSLIVSKGAVLDRVGNYLGQTITQVRDSLRIAFSGVSERTLTVGDVSYVFDEAEPGIIIGQSPDPGTEITGQTEVDLVVSRGPDVETFELDNYVGMPFDEAIVLLAERSIPFMFSVSEPETGRESSVIIAQEPPPGSEIEVGSPITLEMLRPATVPEGTVFGLFEYELPEYAVPVTITLEVQSPEGDRAVVFSMSHPGGPIAVPYIVEGDSTLILMRDNQQVYRRIVESAEEPEDEE